MNIYELRSLIKSLQDEVTSYDNSELISFYKRKEEEMLILIQDKINLGLRDLDSFTNH